MAGRLEAEIYATDHDDRRSPAHYHAFARFMRAVDTPQKLSARRQRRRDLPADPTDADGPGTPHR